MLHDIPPQAPEPPAPATSCMRAKISPRVLETLAIGALFLTACVSVQWQPLGPRHTEAVPGAERAGSEECSVCHESVQGQTLIAHYHRDCETCHGGGSLHIDSEEVSEIRHPSDVDCLECHAQGRATHLEWTGGDHSRADVICSDCHNPHRASPAHLRAPAYDRAGRASASSQLCVDCHSAIAAELQFPSHHPVAEGAMECVSCHDPHSDRRVSSNASEEQCASCHQDYMGPWIFEHTPVAEDCTTCHRPHGAVGDSLLETPQPMLCLSCHSLADEFHHDLFATGVIPNRTITEDDPSNPGEPISELEAATYLRRCTDCHGAIHGSYTDEHLRH